MTELLKHKQYYIEYVDGGKKARFFNKLLKKGLKFHHKEIRDSYFFYRENLRKREWRPYTKQLVNI